MEAAVLGANGHRVHGDANGDGGGRSGAGHQTHAAENGGDGGASRCRGKNGSDLVIKVPVGTVVRDEETGSRRFNAFRDNQYHRIDWKDGYYITVEGRDIVLYTRDARYLLKHSLNDWDALLTDKGWFRCHRAFLINPEHIRSVSTMVNSTLSVQMDGRPEEIPVSRSYSNEFRRMVGL